MCCQFASGVDDTLVEWKFGQCVVSSHQEDVKLWYVEVGVGSEGEGREDGECESVVPVVPLADLTCRVVGAADVDGGERVVSTVQVVVDTGDVAFAIEIGHVFRVGHHVDELVEGSGDGGVGCCHFL